MAASPRRARLRLGRRTHVRAHAVWWHGAASRRHRRRRPWGDDDRAPPRDDKGHGAHNRADDRRVASRGQHGGRECAAPANDGKRSSR